MAGRKYVFEDFDGEQFGDWLVIGKELTLKYGKDKALLCKNIKTKEEKIIKMSELIATVGGIFKGYNSIKIKHGLRDHPLYGIWDAIKQRCFNPNHKQFHDYGGRGIVICEEWRYNFLAFYDWCINNGWRKELEVDRINNDKNYSPSNCQFATHTENNHNTRLIKKNNTIGYRGIFYGGRKKNKKYYTKIYHNGEYIHTKWGFYSDIIAAIYRDKYIIENNLPHMLNFPKLRLKYGKKNDE